MQGVRKKNFGGEGGDRSVSFYTCFLKAKITAKFADKEICFVNVNKQLKIRFAILVLTRMTTSISSVAFEKKNRKLENEK